VAGEDWKTRRRRSGKEIRRVGQVDAATVYEAKINQYSGLTLMLALLSWNGWNHWNRLFFGVFKAMEGLDSQINRKILSDNHRRFYGI
jgi:hypothetical protein